MLRSTSLDEGPPVPPVITYTRGGMQPPSPPEGSADDVEYDPCGPGEPSARCYAHYMQVHTPWMQVDPRAALGLAWAYAMLAVLVAIIGFGAAVVILRQPAIRLAPRIVRVWTPGTRTAVKSAPLL